MVISKRNSKDRYINDTVNFQYSVSPYIITDHYLGKSGLKDFLPDEFYFIADN